MARLTFISGWLLAWLTAAAGAELKLPKHSTPPPAWLLKVEHSPAQPRSGQSVQIKARVRSAITNIVLLYQVVDPGAYIELQDAAFTNNWVSLAMQQTAPPDQNEVVFQAELPGSLQKNRRLVRYRISTQDSEGKRMVAPDFTNVPPNYAYFVYDGIPPWTGAISAFSNSER